MLPLMMACLNLCCKSITFCIIIWHHIAFMKYSSSYDSASFFQEKGYYFLIINALLQESCAKKTKIITSCYSFQKQVNTAKTLDTSPICVLHIPVFDPCDLHLIDRRYQEVLFTGKIFIGARVLISLYYIVC